MRLTQTPPSCFDRPSSFFWGPILFLEPKICFINTGTLLVFRPKFFWGLKFCVSWYNDHGRFSIFWPKFCFWIVFSFWANLLLNTFQWYGSDYFRLFWTELFFSHYCLIIIISHGMIFNWIIMIFKLINFHAVNSFVEIRVQISFNLECMISL